MSLDVPKTIGVSLLCTYCCSKSVGKRSYCLKKHDRNCGTGNRKVKDKTLYKVRLKETARVPMMGALLAGMEEERKLEVKILVEGPLEAKKQNIVYR